MSSTNLPKRTNPFRIQYRPAKDEARASGPAIQRSAALHGQRIVNPPRDRLPVCVLKILFGPLISERFPNTARAFVRSVANHLIPTMVIWLQHCVFEGLQQYSGPNTKAIRKVWPSSCPQAFIYDALRCSPSWQGDAPLGDLLTSVHDGDRRIGEAVVSSKASE